MVIRRGDRMSFKVPATFSDFFRPDFFRPDFFRPDFFRPDFFRPHFFRPHFFRPVVPFCSPKFDFSASLRSNSTHLAVVFYAPKGGFVYRLLLSCFVAVFFGISAVFALCQERDEAIEACVARYDKLDKEIKWIRLDTVATMTPLIPEDEFYELNGVFDFVPHYSSLVLASDGRTFQSSKRTCRTLSAVHTRLKQLGVKIKLGPKGWWPEYAQAKEEFGNVEPEEEFRIWVFDGKNLMDRRADSLSLDGKPLDTLSIVNIDRLKSTFFESSPLQNFLVTFPIPSVPLDDARRRSYRIVDLAMERKLTLLSEADEVNGQRCLKLAFDNNTVWLAPKLNYALVKLQSTKEGHIIWVVEGEYYKNWGSDFWFPSQFTATSYGYPNPEIHPPKYLDKPISRVRTRISKLQVNDPEDEKFFTHGPAATDLVMDEMLAKEIGLQKEGRGIPSVGYQAPSDPAELEKVRDQAIAREVTRVTTVKASRARTLLIISASVAAGYILLTTLLLLWRVRQRHLASTTFEYKP